MKSFDVMGLLKYSNDEFILKTYQKLLNRDPDPDGLIYFKNLLRNGFSKEYVLYLIATSVEAKSKNINIPGIEELKKNIFSKNKKSSVFEKLLNWFQSLFALPKKIDTICSELEKLQLIVEKNSKKAPVIHAQNDIVLANIQGFIMALPAEDLSVLAQLVYYSNLEQGLEKTFCQCIEQGMTVVDVGAHIGLFTLLAARLVGEKGRVYSFEPSSRIFHLLTKNVNINFFTDAKRIQCEQMAVTNKKGKLILFFNKQKTGHSSLYPFKNTVKENVRTISLDDYFGKKNKIDVIKIDAEGSEPFILKGMKKIIDNNPNIMIFIEFCPENLKRASISPDSFLHELRQSGFNIKSVDGITGEIKTVSDLILLNCFSINLMLTRNT